LAKNTGDGIEHGKGLGDVRGIGQKGFPTIAVTSRQRKENKYLGAEKKKKEKLIRLRVTRCKGPG